MIMMSVREYSEYFCLDLQCRVLRGIIVAADNRVADGLRLGEGSPGESSFLHLLG